MPENIFSAFSEEDEDTQVVQGDQNQGGNQDSQSQEEGQGNQQDQNGDQNQQGQQENQAGQQNQNGDQNQQSQGENQEGQDQGENQEGGENQQSQGEGEDDLNPFNIPDEEPDTTNQEPTTQDSVDINELAQRQGIEFDEGEEPSLDLLDIKIQEKINSAKQQFDLSQYNPEAQRVIQHLQENNGSLVDFARNDTIRQLDEFLSYAPENKYSEVRVAELVNNGNSKEDAISQVEEEVSDMTSDDLNEKVKEYDRRAKNIRKQEFDKIISERKKHEDQKRQSQEQVKAQKGEKVKSVIDKTDEMFGFKINDQFKKFAKNNIDNGKFYDVVNINNVDPQQAYMAWMMVNFGDKIINSQKKKSNETSMKSYNDGVKKTQSVYQNTSSGNQNNNHTPGPQGGAKFSTWGEDDEL